MELYLYYQLPGYPTWEIGGQLYPGEKGISELEHIADTF